MKTTTYSRTARRGFTLIELMVVIAILAALAGVAYGPILNQMKKADENTALQNARQIYTAMTNFSQDMNSFPSNNTAERLQKKSPDYDFGPLTGEFSNDYFRQLLYSHMDSEKNFYCFVKTLDGKETHQGDNKIANGQGLQRGENGFAYVMMDEGRAIGTSNTTIPVIMTTVVETFPGDKVVFDGESYRGKGLVLRVDGSTTWVTLDEKDDIFTYPDLFGEDKKGRSIGSRYVVLPPEL